MQATIPFSREVLVIAGQIREMQREGKDAEAHALWLSFPTDFRNEVAEAEGWLDDQFGGE